MNHSKRIIAGIVCLAMAASMAGCSKKESSSSSSSSASNSVSETVEQTSNSENLEYVDKIFGQDILNIQINTTEDDWEYLMNNAADKPWITANISINGESYENVGIKTKGNTSLSQISMTGNDRYSLKVSFGKYTDGQTCYGLDKLVLNNIYSDNTYLKEYMSYNLFQFMNVPSSLCTFANITVNGEHYGFFLALEDTDDSFIERNYGEDSGVEAYKPESMDMAGGMQMPENMQNGGFGFSITRLISLTDEEGNSVEWSAIAGDFDTENIESFTSKDGTTTKLSELDMSAMQSLNIENIVSLTDANGKTLDLSSYTLSMSMGENFPQMPGNGEMPTNMEMPEGMEMPENMEKPENMAKPESNIPDSNSDDTSNTESKAEMPQNGAPPTDMQMPQKGDDGNGFGMDGSSGGVNLVYTDDNVESYSNIFDNNITKVDEEDQNRFIASLKGISESSGEELEKYIDVDEVLRYTACNVFLMNLDSYFSNMGHNYIVTEDNGMLSMIPWDYNLAFGTYQSSNSSEIINFAIDTVFSGVDAEDRPIIGKLLENEEYLEKYHEYLKQIAEEYVQSGLFEQSITDAVTLIDEYVQNDTTSFGDYDSFTAGVEELKKYGSLRAESILGQLDGTIPSTTEEQQDSDALIDASSLDLTKLGSMNRGGGMDKSNRFDKKVEEETE
ncbi:MAG: CotH kinase family protein [Hominimerdicola sp.]